MLLFIRGFYRNSSISRSNSSITGSLNIFVLFPWINMYISLLISILKFKFVKKNNWHTYLVKEGLRSYIIVKMFSGSTNTHIYNLLNHIPPPLPPPHIIKVLAASKQYLLFVEIRTGGSQKYLLDGFSVAGPHGGAKCYQFSPDHQTVHSSHTIKLTQ